MYIRRKTAQKVAFFPKIAQKILSVELSTRDLGCGNRAF
jgi:hypothetical protein